MVYYFRDADEKKEEKKYITLSIMYLIGFFTLFSSMALFLV